jgi:hypothetical protein
MANFDSLDQTFDIVPDEVEVKPIKAKKQKEIIISDKSTDREKDYQYQRAQLYDIVDKMQESLNEAMEVAAESQHPRAFEVVFNGAKHAADVVDKLAQLHKSTRDLEVEEVRVQQNNQTTNNVFMTGSTADLMKMLKESQNK